MLGRSIGFTRWYDRIPELSQAVRMLEHASEHAQQIIAGTIVGALDLHQVAQRSDGGLKKLGTEKVMGLLKSQNKRRWYDRDPMVHQAFNFIFLMDDAMRYETAVKIIIAIKALEESEKHFHPPRVNASLVKEIFNRQLTVLMEQTSFHMNPHADTPRLTLKHGIKPMQDAKESTATEPIVAAGAVDSSHETDGMRIVRLKKISS